MHSLINRILEKPILKSQCCSEIRVKKTLFLCGGLRCPQMNFALGVQEAMSTKPALKNHDYYVLGSYLIQ